MARPVKRDLSVKIKKKKKKKASNSISFLIVFFFEGVCYVWVQVVRVANKTTRLSSHRCDAEMAKGGKRNTAEKTKDRWERSVTGRGQQWPWVYLQCDIENLSVNVVGKNGRLHQRLLITCFGSNNPAIIRISHQTRLLHSLFIAIKGPSIQVIAWNWCNVT